MSASSALAVAAAPPGTASTPDGGLSLLRMAVGPEVLAVPIAEVREILQLSRLTPLPRTPEFVRGVMNLRGAVVPVIDLASRLGGPATQIGRRSCIVVVELRAGAAVDDASVPADQALVVVGLLVDAVYEVFDTLPGEIEAVPPLGTRVAADALDGMTRARGEVVGILSLQRVLAHRELSTLISNHQPH